MRKNNFNSRGLTRGLTRGLILPALFLVFLGGRLYAGLDRLFPTGSESVGFLDFLTGSLSVLSQKWFLISLVVAVLIKIFLLKGRLSLPWKYAPLEKLSLTTLSQTLTELVYLVILMGFLAPALVPLLAGWGAVETASPAMKGVVHMVMILPYYCFLSGLLGVVLVNLITPLPREERRRYFAFGALVSLVLPLVLVLGAFINGLLSKAEPPA